MTLVNKHFENITQPLLFEEVDVGWSSKESPPLILALRTLLERPDLAEMVQSLRLDGYDFPEREFDSSPTISVVSLNIAKASVVIQGTGADFASPWIEGVSDGEVDALVTLLVVILPNVKSVYLGTDFSIEVSYLTMMLSLEQRNKTGVKLPALERVTDVVVKNLYADVVHDELDCTTGFLNFFHLPQLENLCIAVSPLLPELWCPEERPQLDNLTALDLSRATEDQLGSILSLTPNLKVLRWQGYWCPQNNNPESTRTSIDLDKLRVALKKSRHSLQRLTLEVVDNYNPSSEEPEGSIWPMRLVGTTLQLSDFANLRTLCVPLVWMMGWRAGHAKKPLIEKLPRRLEHLTLTDDFYAQKYWKWTRTDFHNVVWHLVTHHYNAESTCLRELYLSGVMFRDYWDRPRRRFVGGVCYHANIKFRVLKTTPWERDQHMEVDERERRYG
ncbi:hypothetical protein FGRMN_2123 [Fusarium graminum]|nr:hypothetical protein FGRMN_2123 [Fusarium graminum]